MTPYYEDELVTLYYGNALEIDAWLTADVLITDPPYGIGGALSAGHKGKKKPGWEPVNPDRAPAWDATLEVRDAVIKKWGARPYAVFGSPRRLDGALPCREFPLVWDKGSVGMGDVTFPWGRGYELIYVNGEGWTGVRESPIIRINLSSAAAREIGHPTPKPIGLMSRIIDKAPAGIIADPFSGSGSTLVAAKQLGRRAIGVELDERYCDIIAARLAQDTLFGGVA